MTSTTLLNDLLRLAQDPTATIDQQWMEAASKAAPYCTLPALLWLKRYGVRGNEAVLAQLAIMFPDRRALALQLGEDADTLAHFYPPQQLTETPDTVTTIDRFLNQYGHSSPSEVEAITRAIFNPVPDYADVLAAQEQQSGSTPTAASDGQDELINKFIAGSRELGQQAAAVPIGTPLGDDEKAEIADATIDTPTVNDDSMLSESLAKMYIKRHKYGHALEIIEGLSAKYPKKSIYFADQIRFLKKLVLNETLTDKK